MDSSHVNSNYRGTFGTTMKIDISDDLKFKNQKSNPFGWNQCEIWYKDERIGWLECGEFDLDPGYSYTSEFSVDGITTSKTIYIKIFKEVEDERVH